MQPPTRRQINDALARARQAGLTDVVAALEARLKELPAEPEPEQTFVTSMVGLGPSDERDERLLDDDELPRWLDRGSSHREHVLSCVAKLWEKYPTHSFCDLIDRWVIAIGTMAAHTSDDAVIESCRVVVECTHPSGSNGYCHKCGVHTPGRHGA